MKNAFALVAAAAAIATLAAPATAAPDGKNRKVTVQNLSSQTLYNLYASPITSKTWEEDLLGQRTLGAVHGGWALTLIDSATGCAVHATLPPGVGYTTVETKVNFTRAIRPDAGTIRAEGQVVTRGRQIATAEARVLSADGNILAHGTSTLMILEARQV